MSSKLKYLAKRVIFMLVSWVIYSDHYCGISDLPDGEKVALSIEPSLAGLIRFLSNLRIRPTLSHHKKCID